MEDDFERSLNFTLKWEGGYSNDPTDPGGETNFGISKRAHPEVDIKNMTREQAAEIYKREYWDKPQCSKFSWPVCAVVFDGVVNTGRIFPGNMFGDPVSYAISMIDSRDQYYRNIVRRKAVMMKYLKGWLNRTRRLRELVYAEKNGKSTQTVG